MRPEKICAECGKSFVPAHEEDECCSAFCRAMHRVSMIDKSCKAQKSAQKAELDAMKKPPNFDLQKFPRARVEWFMALPDEYKMRFSQFLSPIEIEWAREMAHKSLAEEKYFSGFFVKHGKIIETKATSENSEPYSSGQQNEEGDDDYL